MNQNLITIGVAVASAVVTFLLAQPDVTFPAAVKVALGALNIGLTVLARFLPSQGQPIPVEVHQPNETPDGGQG